jgi:hypothetical protein
MSAGASGLKGKSLSFGKLIATFPFFLSSEQGLGAIGKHEGLHPHGFADSGFAASGRQIF